LVDSRSLDYDAGTSVLGRGIRLALVAVLVAAEFLVPGGARLAVAAGTPAPGYAVTDFATDFQAAFCCPPLGPIGVAFDGAGQLYVTDYPAGQLFKFGPSGGSADASHLVVSGLGTGAAGLAFAKDGTLYLAEQWNHKVVRLDPTTGATTQIGQSLDSPTGLAVDPISGDLFTDAVGVVYRLSNPQNPQGTWVPYITLGVDGLTFAPDGTLYASGSGAVWKIVAGQASKIAAVNGADGIALVAPAAGQPITQLVVNANFQIIYLVDFSVTPATVTPIVTNGSRGDFVAVGPDKCLYATQTASIEKITAADGSCPFLPTGVTGPRYVALGDSYASGQGTFDYFPSTDTSSDKCHRSPAAYPELLAHGLYNVTVPPALDFGACSGAKLNNFYHSVSTEEPQLDHICTPNPYVNPHEGELAPCSDSSVQLVTLSVGGDDLGFGDVLNACVTNRSDQQRCLGQDPFVTFGGQLPEQDASCTLPFCVGDGTPEKSYFGIERIELKLRQLYMDIRGRAPHARIVVLGYPRIFPANGADDPTCNLHRIDEGWLTAKGQQVDDVIRFAVNASGVAEYVDTFTSMSGHEACQGVTLNTAWINGVACPLGCTESFHPNKLGQKAFASAVAGQLVKSPPGSCGAGCTWLSRSLSHTDTFQVQVPAGTAVASFATSWSDKDDVVMSITSPGGQVFNRISVGELNHANGDGYEYYNLPKRDPTLLDPTVTLPMVASGTWTVQLATTATNPVAVTFQMGLSAQRDPTPKAEATFDGKVITVPRGGLQQPEIFAIVRFDAKPSSDLDGKVVTYIWDFGDGTTGTGAHVEHKYSNVGKFCPLLTVTDDSGQIGYAAGKILVGKDDPGDCV
jgi:hypothetical protein